MLYSEVGNEKLCHVDVVLYAARHENTDNAVLAESFNAQGGDNRAVFSA